MPLDFRQLDNNILLEADLCIIGAGAAGITLAREFIGQGLKVLLLESGGLDYDDETQALYKGEQTSKKRARSIEDGVHYGITLHNSRLRYFGGTTNHWGGSCAPLTSLDFEKRDWVPHSGWPISLEELNPYYKRARLTCEIGDEPFDKGLWAGESQSPYAFNSDKIVPRFYRFSPPTRFGPRYGKELEEAQNITVLLNANVTQINLNNSASAVESVEIKSLNGKVGTVTAGRFVLACGAIENARTLLLSNKVMTAGVGNQNDLVGRYFMDHIYDTAASVMATKNSDQLQKVFDRYSPGNSENIPVQVRLTSSDKLQKSKKITNMALVLEGEWSKPSSGVGALYRMREASIQGQDISNMSDEMLSVLMDLDDVLPAVSDMVRGKRPKHLPRWTGIGEQAPNPLSRVMLSKEKDQLGLNRVLLDWRLTELDRRTFDEMSKVIAAEFGRLGIGRIQRDAWLEESFLDVFENDFSRRMYSGYHQSGTTRMSDNPKTGVVDKNCRVHGIENLYIAGSSVFPTIGYANPTFTIVALTHRLADYIRGNKLG